MSKKQTYTILAGTIIFMLFAVSVFVFLFRDIKLKNENSSRMALEIERHTAQRNNLSNLQRTIKETKDQRKVLESYIVDEEQIDKFIGWLEEMGAPVGVKVVVNSVSRVGEGSMLSVDITSSGSFNEVLNFSSLLENSSYKINIEKFFLSKMIQGGDEENPEREYWQSQITFNVVSEGRIEEE